MRNIAILKNCSDIEKNQILSSVEEDDNVIQLGKAHIIGSYRMDMMAWNDLDIDIENDAMSLDKIYELSTFIINTFHPVWYEPCKRICEFT